MIDILDIIDLDLESVNQYKKYLVNRYFFILNNDIKPSGKCIKENDIKYLEVCPYNKPLDYYELTHNLSNVALLQFDFDTKADIKKYINKVKKFISINISSEFLDGIARTQYNNGKTRIFIENNKKIIKNGQFKKDFLDKASKYVIALSLSYEIQWESILYKRYFELDNK